MKALYVTSVESWSGKTAFCLAIGRHFINDGKRIGYLKPLSTQPWRDANGNLTDEDAAFISQMLELDADPASLAPLIITSETLRQRLRAGDGAELLGQIKQSAKQLGAGKDLLLIEGGASLRQGYAVGLSNPSIAQALAAPVLVIVKYRGEMEVLDDALTAQFRLGDQLLGVVVNQVPEQDESFMREFALPHLIQQGIQVLGQLPLRPALSAVSVAELADLLDARVLTETPSLDSLVHVFTVGAMNAEAALSRFRRQQEKAVITGGDRTDIQLAALETSTAALVLTGNLDPSPLILNQAEALGIPVLLVASSTMETVERVERSLGNTRLGHAQKLETFEQLVAEHVNIEGIVRALNSD